MDFQFPVSPDAFNIMLKPVGPSCNLDCTYCYYLEKKDLFPGKANYKMDEELLERFISQYIKAQNVPVVSFVWQGGEPSMLGVEYFRKAVEIQNRYAGEKRIENSFQTNGTFLTDEFCRFFKDNQFLIGLSIDGPQHLHDYYRKDKRGEPTWEKVMKGIELLKKHGVEFNTLSVVNRMTSREPLAVYNFLKQIGSTFMQFIPIVERKAVDSHQSKLSLVHGQYPEQAEVTEWSVNPREYGNFMMQIYDDWVRKDVGRYYVQLFDVSLASWVGARPGLCVFSEECGTAAVMEHNGNIYSCDHYVYEDHLLGNMNEKSLTQMMGSVKQSLFGKDKKSSLTAWCRSCPVRFACHGDCPKHRFATTPQSDPGLSYLCQGYKMFFEHVKPTMDFMADEIRKQRAPANVMQWIARKESAQKPAQASIGRNQPCPCGSGKKFKKCHANQPGF